MCLKESLFWVICQNDFSLLCKCIIFQDAGSLWLLMTLAQCICWCTLFTFTIALSIIFFTYHSHTYYKQLCMQIMYIFIFVMVSVGIYSEMICLFKKEKANLLQLVQFQAVSRKQYSQGIKGNTLTMSFIWRLILLTYLLNMKRQLA